MSLSLLERVNHGWGEVEPVVIGLMAMNKSFMLIGRHGTGKTRLARTLSQGYGAHGFAFYDATKDDLISIAGIPDPEAIRAGRLRFVPHERSIWDKSTIVVDEITRANKESQNLWLEILEERTCFGLPLAYRSVIATANPESYAAAFQLDEALLDRFHGVIPVPDMQDGVSGADVEAMIKLATRPGNPLESAELARVFADVQRAHGELIAEGALDRVATYLAQVIPALLGILRNQGGPYLSPRTYARNLPETILALAAYHRVAGAAEPLRRAAAEGLRYAVATKAQIKPAMLEQLHQSSQAILTSGVLPPAERIRLEIAAPTTFEARLEYVRANWRDLTGSLAVDEVEKVLGELLRGTSAKGEQDKLVALKVVLDEVGYKGDALRQVDGRLLIALNAATSQVLPRLARLLDGRTGAERDRASAAIDLFRAMVAGGTFLGNHAPEVRRLKTWLIDLREGDVAGDDDTLFNLFASLELPAPRPDVATPPPSRQVAERRIEQALMSLGATFADCAGLVVYDPDCSTSYWAYDPRTGDEAIHVGPMIAALEVGCIEMALRHELLHRSMFHGLGEQYRDQHLSNLTLDVCINRLLLEAYPDKLRKTSLAVYGPDVKTTPLALADCTADPRRLSPKLAAMWTAIWARLPDGSWPKLNPASLYFRLVRISSDDSFTGFVAACTMCGDRKSREAAQQSSARSGRRVSARAARVLTAIADDLNKKLPAGSSLGEALSELSVIPTPIGTGAVERFLRQIKIRRIASETARKITEPWTQTTRIQPFPGVPTRRGLIYIICGFTDLTRLYWNREVQNQGARLAIALYMDVSGSMMGKLGVIASFIEALKDFPLKTRSFDTAVRDVDPAAVAAGRIAGGGGTDFDAPIRDLVEDRELAAGVLFTDGEATLTSGIARRLETSGKRLYVVYLVDGGRTVSSPLDAYATEAITVACD